MIHSSSRTWVSIGLALVLLVGLVQSASLPPAERDFLTEFMLESGQVFYPPRWDILRASYACDENWEGIECVPFGLNSRITLMYALKSLLRRFVPFAGLPFNFH